MTEKNVAEGSETDRRVSDQAEHEPVLDRISVVRDNTFSRAVVDQIAILGRGRDLELSCLQHSAILTAMEEKGHYYDIAGDSVMTEVVRLRMAYGVAVNFAMDLLREGITSGRFKGDAIVKNVAEWTAAAREGVGDADGD